MGKTTLGGLFGQAGWSVADSDLLAREVVEPGQPALAEIRIRFGAEMIDAEGCLRRERLAECVFSDPARRRELEAILHPRIRERWHAQCLQWRHEGRAGAVVVVPLLFEVASEKEFDRVLCVACSGATQQRRLRERGWSDAHIAQRLQAQWPIEKKMGLADFVLWSEGGPDVLRAQWTRVVARWTGL